MGSFGQAREYWQSRVAYPGKFRSRVLHPKENSIEKRSRPKEFAKGLSLSKEELLLPLEQTIDWLLKLLNRVMKKLLKRWGLATVREPWGLSLLNVITHAEGHAMQIVTLARYFSMISGLLMQCEYGSLEVGDGRAFYTFV